MEPGVPEEWAFPASHGYNQIRDMGHIRLYDWIYDPDYSMTYMPDTFPVAKARQKPLNKPVSKHEKQNTEHLVIPLYIIHPWTLKVVVKTKYLQRLSPHNYAWLSDYIYTKTSYIDELKR